MLGSLTKVRNITRTPITTICFNRGNSVFKQFFDDEANFGKSELRPKKRPGRSWNVEELRLKSNIDMHKLWYICLKERNMLLTMQAACVEQARYLPNPERLDRVEKTMKNIEKVVHERNDAFFKLETGDGADPRSRTVTSFMGFTYDKKSTEHYSSKHPEEIDVEIPYLDDDSHLMQKLWKEKERLKNKERIDETSLRAVKSQKMSRFQRGSPKVFNR